MVLSQVPKIVAENKTSLQQQQTLRRIGAQREITVPNNNVPPPRQKRSLVPNILKKKKSPAPSNATTTSSSSESSTTKEPLHQDYLRSPKLQKSLSTATEVNKKKYPREGEEGKKKLRGLFKGVVYTEWL
jgi:hypothetical protein